MNRLAPITRRRWSLALGTSALARGLAQPSVASAQCTPDPTVANGTTTCTGTDANGIRVTTPGTILNVGSGASVTNTGAAAIAVDVSRSTDVVSAANTINVQGSVSAAGENAITASSGATGADVYDSAQQLTLTVSDTGSVTGGTALALLQSPGNTNGTVSASVDNAGTLTGTGGIALLGNVAPVSNGYANVSTSFTSIANAGNGRIVGAIVGPVAALTNAGSIDGGANSALDSSAGFSPIISNAAGATIRSSSAAATILAGPSNSLSVTNAGTISNLGSGAALTGGTVTITNQNGGQIVNAGATSIMAATSLNLTNLGSVTGNVIAGNGTSTIDSTGGKIRGSLTLGNGNDTLVARYAGSRILATGITGAVDAGGGSNVERVVFAADTSVTTPIDLDAGFQQLVLAPADNVTATLETSFSTASTLVLAGGGAVVNRATIVLPATAVTDLDYGFGSSASFRNEGSITASPPTGLSAVGLLLNNHRFTNTGIVSVNGGVGVSVSYNPVINTGSITASGTGVALFDGVLPNGGTIVSTGGAGVELTGNVGYTGSNSGTIRGATAGAVTSVYLTNTGTISSAGTGVVVQPYGYLINAAGGIVNGGSGGAITVSAFNAGVANAGTINGNVAFNGFGSNNNLTYIALTGGVLNGDLSLTGGATLVTDLVNTGPGQFAGITGKVTADSSSMLRYAVHADASATLPTSGVGPFSLVGYQIDNGAMLTLTAPGQVSRQTLLLAGTGSVSLDAAITTTDASAIQTAQPVTYPGGAATTSALAITSRGAITSSRSNSTVPYYAGVVAPSPSDSFSNAGSIAVTDRTGYRTAAISGGSSVVNTGTIVLDGSTGISGTATVSNAGSIVEASNAATSRGVLDVRALTNTGTISVSGAAVQFTSNYNSSLSSGTPTIVNAGTLVSTGGAAIASDASGVGEVQITNQTGGTISGVGRAIQIASANVVNAGTINGTVDLGYLPPSYTGGTPMRSYSSSTFYGGRRHGGGRSAVWQRRGYAGANGQ